MRFVIHFRGALLLHRVAQLAGANSFANGVLLYSTRRCAKRFRLTRAHISAQILTVIERRITIAQSLYAVGHRAVRDQYLLGHRVSFSRSVQLNYAFAPRFRWPVRS